MKKKSSENPLKYSDIKIEDFEKINDISDNDIFNSDFSVNKDFIFNSKKSGLLFPSIVILSAILISASIMLISARIINFNLTDFKTLTAGNELLESALMSKFKADSDKKIIIKDKEIIDIKNKLKNYDFQLKNLREIVFAKQAGGDIPPEAEIMEYSGLSISELEKTITTIEDKKQEAEKELDIETKEKKRLLKEAENQNIPVVETKESGLINISEIQKRLEKEKSFSTQMYLFQRNIFYNLEEKDFKKAKENINNYKTLIHLPSNNDLPEINKIREYSDNLIRVFEEYILLQEDISKTNNKKNNYMLLELNLPFLRIIDDIEKQDFDSANRNITGLRSLLNIISDNNYPELKRRKSEYLRSTAIMEEYITLKTERKNIKVMDQRNLYENTKRITDPKTDDFVNLYTDFSGDTSLYGKIASMENQKISIENFFNIMVYPGDLFLIMEDDTEIARGIISSAASSSARGEIESIKSKDTPPAVNNLIYIVRK